MKKTIAKLMAAAMLLSAVPAVTMPSFVSKAGNEIAATNTTTSTFATQFLGGEGTVKAAADGEIFSFKLPRREVNTAKLTNNSGNAFADKVLVSSDEFTLNAYASGGLGEEITKLIKVDKATISGNELVHVKASLDVAKMTTAQKTTFINAVKNGTNKFKVKIERKCGAPIAGGLVSGTTYLPGDTNYYNAVNYIMGDNVPTGTNTYAVVSERVYSIGGTYDGGKIKTGVQDEDGLLMDGNVYAKLDKVLSDGIAEVELLKQDSNEVNKLKNNDQLRGKLLKLNEVKVSGVTYKVGKLGAQCLKEAKMKKIQLKNCSKVGKGAMRKCKQLRNVNLKDKNKVRKIHAKAFYDCKNLKNIAIDARKLNTVGNESFTKVKKNCRIKLKASKSKYNQVVKKIKKANKKNTTLKYARIAP
jgi:enoyl reductase-like protein